MTATNTSDEDSRFFRYIREFDRILTSIAKTKLPTGHTTGDALKTLFEAYAPFYTQDSRKEQSKKRYEREQKKICRNPEHRPNYHCYPEWETNPCAHDPIPEDQQEVQCYTLDGTHPKKIKIPAQNNTKEYAEHQAGIERLKNMYESEPEKMPTCIKGEPDIDLCVDKWDQYPCLHKDGNVFHCYNTDGTEYQKLFGELDLEKSLSTLFGELTVESPMLIRRVVQWLNHNLTEAPTYYTSGWENSIWTAVNMLNLLNLEGSRWVRDPTGETNKWVDYFTDAIGLKNPHLWAGFGSMPIHERIKLLKNEERSLRRNEKAALHHYHHYMAARFRAYRRMTRGVRKDLQNAVHQ